MTRELSREAVLPVQAAGALTGETPFWDAGSGMLWWIDIQGQRLLGHSPTTAAAVSVALPAMPGLIAGLRGGGLVLGLEDGLYSFETATLRLGPRLVAVEDDKPGNRLNDGKADPEGRLWFGSMDKTGSGASVGALYRFDAAQGLSCQRTDVRIPNAIAFGLDGRTMYFSDSRTGVVEAAAYDPATGEVSGARVFATFAEGEHPDGACIDSEDHVWVAVVGGARIERRTPDGGLAMVVQLPVSRPTMPMLGGPDGRTLYVTSQRRFLSGRALLDEPLAGHLLAVRVDALAAPVHRANIASPEVGA